MLQSFDAALGLQVRTLAAVLFKAVTQEQQKLLVSKVAADCTAAHYVANHCPH